MRLRLPHAAARRQSHADDCLIEPQWPPKATYCPGFRAFAGMEVDLPPDAGGFREARASTVSDAAEQHKERRLLVGGIPSYVPRLDARPDTGYCMSREPACLGCSIAAPGRAWALHCTVPVLYRVVYLAMPSDQTHGVWIDDAQLGSDQGRIVSLQTPRSSMGRL
jgi:hypothetical protein